MAKDDACVRFLQWALPQLQMRWPGFRRVRSQVCKRLQGRMRELQISDFSRYQRYCEQHTDEWRRLDQYCRVTVTRFYRDKMVFTYLAEEVLPALARDVVAKGRDKLSCWSVGCASGEEPYTLALLWHFLMRNHFPALELKILASEVNETLIARAKTACYAYATIKNLPDPWREQAFINENDHYCLLPEFQQPVSFWMHDVRQGMPSGTFDLILCRNLVFTYYNDGLQRKLLQQFHQVLKPNGFLLLGVHEKLPDQDGEYFRPWSQRLGIYQKVECADKVSCDVALSNSCSHQLTQ